LSKILLPNDINTIIDNQNRFIKITVKLEHFEITWKDSYRIFPVSLDKLCKNFGIDGKSSVYDQRFNNLSLFDNLELFNLFKEYSLQDSICLLNALNTAQRIYYKTYKIDITSIVSTSTLSLKIFRKHFLNHDIPVLKGWCDSFIRNSYFGGATDYYKAYAENIKYYDINSLYPFAMKKDMPHEILEWIKDMKDIKLEDFFGFCKVEVYCPRDIIRPLLPHKYNNETIFPTGKWVDTYFSEELKAVIPYGYKFRLLKGYRFSKINLFNEYVDHFYDKKKNAKLDSERLIAKMHLNQLYGIFGRKQELLETKNIYRKDLINYVSTRTIKNVMEINNEIVSIIFINNINKDILNELDKNLDTNFSSQSKYNSIVMSNVSIASAVTSYARIHMIPFKLSDNSVYTDTDSVFWKGRG
jgi:hypothetical protein